MSIVTVTGGTGYIASWIIKDLLNEGHEVRTTVRDKKKVAKYQHLLDIEKVSKGVLSIYEADLLEETSFDEAIRGSDYVMHTASPFVLDDKNNPQKNLVDPAVKGTQNVLGSVNRSETVKRVVLTSSVAAIFGDNIDLVKETIDEKDWNTTSSLEHNAYSYSKTQAEKAAWKIAEDQKRWSLVTIHPGFVLGPSLTKRVDSTSIKTILMLLRGEIAVGAPNLNFVYSDVRDVSKGHFLAAFTPKANGRYIIANESGGLMDLGKIVDKQFPGNYKVPKHFLPNWLIWLIAPAIGFTRRYAKNNLGYPIAADNKRSLEELKMVYRDLETTVIDHVNQLNQDGLI